ncbi:MAG: PaaI family thioesterase [Rhodobacteraceae bacterium]|nr:PaaI family thioesterase [Paracoccaceae bacterium]
MPEPFFASSLKDLLPLEQALAMSGLDFMRGVLEGRLPAPPISKILNYQLHSVEKGRVCFRGSPTFDACNPMGTVHGGWYGTLLDSAMACAVMTMVENGAAYTTLEYKVNITRAIPIDTEIEAIGEVDHFGRSTGVASGRIVGVADGKVYATGSTTCLVLRP